jgi:hypothetical protein
MKIRHFAITLLSIVQLSHAAWKVETVDSGAGVGDASSLALSSSGVPHIAYYRPNNTAGFANLYYATKAGSAWTTESIYDGFAYGGAGELTSIALTDQGNPAVTFTRATTFLSYSIRSGGSWTTTSPIKTDGGAYSSLLWHGTEATPTPLAAYYDGTTQYLNLAYYTAAWNSTTLDNTGNSGAYCSIAEIGTYAGIAYIDAGKLGFQESNNDGANWAPNSDNAFAPFNTITNVAVCALALAPAVNSASTNIRAHIIYYDSNFARFYYVTNDTVNGVWATKELITQSGLNTVGQLGVSIAVGSDGIPQVAFLDYSTNQISYSKRVNGAWTTPEVVDGSTLGGANCAIKLDANNLPGIAYGAFAFDSGSATYPVSAVKFAAFSNASNNTGGGKPTLSIPGKSKRTTTHAKLKIKGSASNATAVQWKAGSKPFKKVTVSGGKWTANVGPLVIGKNKVKFRAVSSTGATSAIKTLVVTRTE